MSPRKTKDQEVDLHPAGNRPFEVGDQVYKPKGYFFPGTVLCIFTTSAGEERCVVEQEGSGGLLHIFAATQIEHAPPSGRNSPTNLPMDDE